MECLYAALQLSCGAGATPNALCTRLHPLKKTCTKQVEYVHGARSERATEAHSEIKVLQRERKAAKRQAKRQQKALGGNPFEILPQPPSQKP